MQPYAATDAVEFAPTLELVRQRDRVDRLTQLMQGKSGLEDLGVAPTIEVAIVNDLSEAIRENSDVANVISAAVNQQTTGLSQIASAIEQINLSATENRDVSVKIDSNVNKMTDALNDLGGLVARWRLERESGDEMDAVQEDDLDEGPIEA